MKKSAKKWLKRLLREHEPVIGLKELSKILEKNPDNFTEDITITMLIPWGTEHDTSYLEVLQLFISAALVSYTHEQPDKARHKYTISLDPLLQRKRLFACLGGPFSEESILVLRFLEEVSQGMSFTWVNPVRHILRIVKGLPAERAAKAWTTVRDVLAACCCENPSTYWPTRGISQFLANITYPTGHNYSDAAWPSCASCSHQLRVALTSIKGDAWIAAHSIQHDLPAGQKILIDEKIWTQEGCQKPPPADVPVWATVESSSPATICVSYTSSRARDGVEFPRETIDVARKSVFVSCEDASPVFSQNIEAKVPDMVSLLLRHKEAAYGPKHAEAIDEAQNMAIKITRGDVTFERDCPVLDTNVALDVADASLLSESIRASIRFIKERMFHIAFPRNSKITGTGTVSMRYLSSAARMSHQPNKATIISSRGLFRFDSAHFAPRSEHYQRCFYGMLSEDGLPKLGYMRLLITDLTPTSEEEVFELDPSSKTITYSGHFHGNRPSGMGTVIVAREGQPMVSISGKWRPDKREIDGKARIAIFEPGRSIYYTGSVSTDLLPHGKGKLEVFTNTLVRKSFTGHFQNGEPTAGVLFAAKQGNTRGSSLRRYSGEWESFRFRKGSYSTDEFLADGTWNPESGALEGKGTLSCSAPSSMFLGDIKSAGGEWQAGLPNGCAIVSRSAAGGDTYYTGDVQDGIPHGKGTLKTWNKNRTAVMKVETGLWDQGRPAGPFVITTKAGKSDTTAFAIANRDGKLRKITAREYHTQEMMSASPKRSLKRKRKREDASEEFLCPITRSVMSDPHIAEDGNTYELWAIKKWLSSKQTSPLTNMAMGPTLIPNRSLKNLIIKRA